jgi:hypothetical protein
MVTAGNGIPTARPIFIFQQTPAIAGRSEENMQRKYVARLEFLAAESKVRENYGEKESRKSVQGSEDLSCFPFS